MTTPDRATGDTPGIAHEQPFADLLDANRRYAEHASSTITDGVARAGVAVVTCMDARIDPLAMIGLRPGDAKVLRNPGGRVDERTLTGLVLAVNLLGVDRILVVQHTKCAMASPADDLRRRLADASGGEVSGLRLDVIDDQAAALRSDVEAVRRHALVSPDVSVGGFLYDVSTRRLQPVV